MKTYIYESPDKGDTIYRREFMADHNTRELIKESAEPKVVMPKIRPTYTYSKLYDGNEYLI